MDDSPQPEKNKEESNVGPFVGIIIVVVLVVLGGVYFLITQEIKLHQTLQPENAPSQTNQESS
jgi:hypothetical protein